MQTIEDQFAHNMIKLFNELEQRCIEKITTTVLPYEEYAQEVGYLRSLGDSKTKFLRLRKQYFSPHEKEFKQDAAV